MRDRQVRASVCTGRCDGEITPVDGAGAGSISSSSHENTFLGKEKIYFSGCSTGEAVIYFLVVVQFYKKTLFFRPHCAGYTTFQMRVLVPVIFTSSPPLNHSDLSALLHAGDTRMLTSSLRGAQETVFVPLNALFHHDVCVQ